MAGKDDAVVPGLQLDDKLAHKLDGLDDHLEPIEKELHEDAGKGGSETKETAPEKDKTEESDEGSESKEEGDTDAAGADSGSGDSSDDEPEGYAIDEGDEESEEDTSVSGKPEEAKQPDTRQLTPEQKYILDNIAPIKVRGYVGGSDEVKEFDVYAPEYLPQGFKFVDEREMAIASRAFGQLEQRAVELQQDWRNQETRKASDEFKQREDVADRQDIAALQRDGKIPLFKSDPNSAAFEKDPGVKLVQEVLDYKEQQNAKYLEQYNAGRPYKHIGFEEAFRMYQRDNPTKGNPAQVKEDKERTDLARRTNKSNGTSEEATNKVRIHSGMSGMELENLIESKTRDW